MFRFGHLCGKPDNAGAPVPSGGQVMGVLSQENSQAIVDKHKLVDDGLKGTRATWLAFHTPCADGNPAGA